MNFVDDDRPNSQFAAIIVSVLIALIFIGVVLHFAR